MTTQEIFKLINENPAFHLATVEGDQPRVRGMLLYRADENGFIFHTASTKDVFAQIKKNPKAEMCFSCNGVQIRVTSGPAIEKPGDLAALLTNLNEGDVLFIDEIHRLSRAVEEVLYPAMEDNALDIIIGKGPSARSIRLDLPRFTLVGATTRSGQLSAPLRDRFGIPLRLELYTPEELAQIVKRSAGILDIYADDGGALEIASRSRGTPRIANRLLKRARDFAQVMSNGVISEDNAKIALGRMEIDEIGLDNIDRLMLTTMIRNFNGGPVGLETLAATIGEEAITIEDVYEPYLMQIGFLEKKPRGRVATPLAYKHLGYNIPDTNNKANPQTSLF